MRNIEKEISLEILDNKVKVANYIKKLIYVALISDLFIYIIIEILNLINLSNLEHRKIIPIIFRVKNFFNFFKFNKLNKIGFDFHKYFNYDFFRNKNKRNEDNGNCINNVKYNLIYI
jgi:hypothetical protein